MLFLVLNYDRELLIFAYPPQIRERYFGNLVFTGAR